MYPDHKAAMAAPDDLIKILEGSQLRLENEYARIATEPRYQYRLRRIRRISKMVDEEIAKVKAESTKYLTQIMPQVYATGGGAAKAAIGLAEFGWTQAATSAVQVLAQSSFDQVLKATDYMREDAKRWVREATKEITLEGQFEGLTTQQMAKRFKKLAPKAVAASGLPVPITSITYANGAQHTLDSYGKMLFRTDTAKAYNAGVLNTSEEFGVTKFEIFDGQGCGLTSHDDPLTANGMIVSAQVARSNTLSHPNCQRSFGAVPDPATPLSEVTRSGVQPDTVKDTEAAYRSISSGGSAGAQASGPGGWSLERTKLHDKIVNGFLDDVPLSSKPKMTMTGGGPASGKSTMIDANPTLFPDKSVAVHVDADAVKLKLPEYQDLVAVGDNRAAGFAHEESSYLVKRILTESYKKNVDVLFDSVGGGGAAKLGRKVEEARSAGLEVIANYASLDTDLAVKLSNARGVKTGRLVAEDVVRKAHREVTDTFIDSIDQNLFDAAKLFDTNVQDVSRLVAQTTDEGFEILDRALWNDFVEKGSRTIAEVEALGF
jgi:predicted ABC-type ATPase